MGSDENTELRYVNEIISHIYADQGLLFWLTAHEGHPCQPYRRALRGAEVSGAGIGHRGRRTR